MIRIAQMEEGEEKNKHKNCKKIVDLDERKKYSLGCPLYTAGKGVKRTFGNSVLSNDGVDDSKEMIATWKRCYWKRG